MLPQRLCIFKLPPFITLWTNIRACVHGLLVFGEVRPLLEGGLAQVTRVRSFVGVHQHVTAEIAHARECLQAYLTRVLRAQFAGGR